MIVRAKEAPPLGYALRWMRPDARPVWLVELQQRHEQSADPIRVKSTEVHARTAREAATIARRRYIATYGTYSGSWHTRVRRGLRWHGPWQWRDPGFVVHTEKAPFDLDAFVRDYEWRGDRFAT